jgi:D-alanine transaminase
VSRSVYVNNKFVHEEDAKISIFDRAFLFSDAVYEVTTVLDGKLIGFSEHMIRLEESLKKLSIEFSIDVSSLLLIHREIIKRNKLKEGLVYLQVTRGVSDRNFIFPEAVDPTLILFTQKESLLTPERLNRKLKIISRADIRWERRDIKTTQLLAASMLKTEAKQMGKDDVWMLDGEFVTEGTSNNAFIINTDGKIITRNLSNMILPGVTRNLLINYAKELKLTVQERPFTISEAYQASEAFITSATNFITSVVEIDGKEIGNGKTGKITLQLRNKYMDEIKKSSI